MTTLQKFLNDFREGKLNIIEGDECWEIFDDKKYGTWLGVSKEMFPTKEQAMSDAERTISEAIKQQEKEFQHSPTQE